jgi:hypothetical protein
MQMVSSVPRRPSARSTQNQNIGRVPGAQTNPPLEIVAITETGSRGGDLTDHMSHTLRPAAAFCIAETANDLIDGAAVLASRGAVFVTGIGTNPAVRKESS